MSKVVSLNTPIATPISKIGEVVWNWNPPAENVEYLPGFRIADIKIKGGGKELIIPIKIIPADLQIDATIDPPKGEEMTFWIKYWLLEHFGNCDTCLRYVIIHEFTHLMPQFQFSLPWELRGFNNEKELMYKIHHYLVDSLVDSWNVTNKNYEYNDPIKFVHHMGQENKIKLTSTTREELFEKYIYVAKFVSHCKTWRDNLYQHTHMFPHQLRDKYHQLLDALSGDYSGPNYPIYELVRDIAELMLCPSKKDIMNRELKRRFRTLSEIGTVLFNERNIEDTMQQFLSEQLMNIYQLRNCLFGWKRTLKRFSNISNAELRYIDDLLSEPLMISEFPLSDFIDNMEKE